MLFGRLKYCFCIFLSYFLGDLSRFYLFNSLYNRYVEVFLLRLSKFPGKSPLTFSLRTETRLLTFYVQRNEWQSTDPYNLLVFSSKPKDHPLLYLAFYNPKSFWDSSGQIRFFLSLSPLCAVKEAALFCSAKFSKSVFQKCVEIYLLLTPTPFFGLPASTSFKCP